MRPKKLYYMLLMNSIENIEEERNGKDGKRIGRINLRFDTTGAFIR